MSTKEELKNKIEEYEEILNEMYPAENNAGKNYLKRIILSYEKHMLEKYASNISRFKEENPNEYLSDDEIMEMYPYNLDRRFKGFLEYEMRDLVKEIEEDTILYSKEKDYNAKKDINKDIEDNQRKYNVLNNLNKKIVLDEEKTR